MEQLFPIILLLLGLGAVCLGLGSLIRFWQGKFDYWLFGLGVRTRFGAVKVLVVALGLIGLSYVSHRQGSLVRILKHELMDVKEDAKTKLAKLVVTSKSIKDLQAQIHLMSLEDQEFRRITSRQKTNLANQLDRAEELKLVLNQQQSAAENLRKRLTSLKGELEGLRREKEVVEEIFRKKKERLQLVESQLGSSQRQQEVLRSKIARVTAQKDSESKKLIEKIEKLKRRYQTEKQRADLLRYSVRSREVNDLSLEQAIERLFNLITDQPDVTFPRQTDIVRAIQKIHDILREGISLTQRAREAGIPSEESEILANDPS